MAQQTHQSNIEDGEYGKGEPPRAIDRESLSRYIANRRGVGPIIQQLRDLQETMLANEDLHAASVLDAAACEIGRLEQELTHWQDYQRDPGMLAAERAAKN